MKNCIVSIIPKYFTSDPTTKGPPSFPPIIGSGFIVADGLVATNAHVVRAFERLPRLGTNDEWPAMALILYEIVGRGVAEIPLDIIGAFDLGKFNPGKKILRPEVS